MFETILAGAIVTAGSALLIYATISRLFRFHRPFKWDGRGQVCLAGELAIGVFILCGGLAVLQGSGLWLIPALAAWIIGYLSQRRTNRQHAAEEHELRALNSANYSGVFDHPPPDDIDCLPEAELDVFDAGACTYLGRAGKHDLKVLIDGFRDMPEQGANDIFLIPESLGILAQGSLSEEFAKLLQKAFEESDFLVLRWMPPSHTEQRLST